MDTALLLLRVTVGLLLAGHGAQKLFGWFGGYGLRGTSGWLHSQGYRPALLWAFLAGLGEFAGGLLLALGFLSPLGSIGVGVVMLTAITKVHWPKVWATEGGFEHPLVNLAAALALGIAGPGAFSLDALWGTALPSTLSLLLVVLAALGYLVGMIASAANAPSKKTGSGAAKPDNPAAA